MSVYYMASIAITLAVVFLTCVVEKKLFRGKESITETSKVLDSDVNVRITKKRPLVLAKEIRESLPKEIQAMERKVQEQQLAAIYELMQQEKMDTISLEEMQDQLKLYGY